MKKYSALLLCLIVSTGIWVIHKLSQTSSDVVSVQVIAQSNIDGFATTSTMPASVSVRCRATGFKLVSLSRTNRKPATIQFEPGDFTKVGDGVFSIPSSYVYKYSEQIFGSGVTIENLVSQDVIFRFPPEDHKKVPIFAVRTMDFRQQYMPLGDLRLDPDSVIVYGDPDLIQAIDKVLTVPVSLNDIHSDVSGVAGLEPVRGIRYSFQEVNYYQTVCRYVEIVSDIPVKMINVPHGKKVSIYPGIAKVTFDCSFPMSDNPSDKASLYVDYNDFVNSLSGKCLVKCSDLPNSVIRYTVDPPVCECFEMVE